MKNLLYILMVSLLVFSCSVDSIDENFAETETDALFRKADGLNACISTNLVNLKGEPRGTLEAILVEDFYVVRMTADNAKVETLKLFVGENDDTPTVGQNFIEDKYVYTEYYKNGEYVVKIKFSSIGLPKDTVLAAQVVFTNDYGNEIVWAEGVTDESQKGAMFIPNFTENCSF